MIIDGNSKYTIEELKHLRNIRAKAFDNYGDSACANERQDFFNYTETFFEWLEKMEKTNKVKYLLSIS